MHSFSFVKINTGDDVVGQNDDGGDVGENDCDDDDYDQDDGDDDEDDCDDCDSDHLQVWQPTEEGKEGSQLTTILPHHTHNCTIPTIAIPQY